MMRDTITMAIPGPTAPLTAAEPLSAPRTLLQRPEQPDRPLQHRLPVDASGLAEAEEEEEDDAPARATMRAYSSGASGPLMVAPRPEASAGRRCWSGWSGCSGRCSRVRGADRGSAAVWGALGPGIAMVMVSLIIAFDL